MASITLELKKTIQLDGTVFYGIQKNGYWEIPWYDTEEEAKAVYLKMVYNLDKGIAKEELIDTYTKNL